VAGAEPGEEAQERASSPPWLVAYAPQIAELLEKPAELKLAGLEIVELTTVELKRAALKAAAPPTLHSTPGATPELTKLSRTELT
jgi:hypothetical protein